MPQAGSGQDRAESGSSGHRLRQARDVVVVDHGIGIALKERTRIFEKFERAVPENHYGGFGLGLWTAREIIEAHGGQLTVTSEPGLGSTFVAELPIGDIEAL